MDQFELCRDFFKIRVIFVAGKFFSVPGKQLSLHGAFGVNEIDAVSRGEELVIENGVFQLIMIFFKKASRFTWSFITH